MWAKHRCEIVLNTHEYKDSENDKSEVFHFK